MITFLYILESSDSKKYYTGVSANPQKRLIYHNSIEKGFTSRYRPWKIIFTKEYANKIDAMRVERKIKSWKSRKMIERFISGDVIM